MRVDAWVDLLACTCHSLCLARFGSLWGVWAGSGGMVMNRNCDKLDFIADEGVGSGRSGGGGEREPGKGWLKTSEEAETKGREQRHTPQSRESRWEQTPVLRFGEGSFGVGAARWWSLPVHWCGQEFHCHVRVKLGDFYGLWALESTREPSKTVPQGTTVVTIGCVAVTHPVFDCSESVLGRAWARCGWVQIIELITSFDFYS